MVILGALETRPSSRRATDSEPDVDAHRLPAGDEGAVHCCFRFINPDLVIQPWPQPLDLSPSPGPALFLQPGP
jgi:hypothetical protein